MIYNILIKPSALKEVEALPRAIRIRVKAKIDSLRYNARPVGARKLHASTKVWRVRVAEYRVIYEIDEGVLTITILRVAHRKDVYR